MLGNRWLISFDNRDNDIGRSLSGERSATRGHFIKHDAETPDICSFINGDTSRLFGRHVSRCADDDARRRMEQERWHRRGGRTLMTFGQFCETEVEDLYE